MGTELTRKNEASNTSLPTTRKAYGTTFILPQYAVVPSQTDEIKEKYFVAVVRHTVHTLLTLLYEFMLLYFSVSLPLIYNYGLGYKPGTRLGATLYNCGNLGLSVMTSYLLFMNTAPA